VGEGAISSPAIQLQYRTPARAVVPMEEREARASRFVSHLVGHTDSDKQPSPSSPLRLWQQAKALRQAQLEELVWADPSQLVVLP
jgi:hypothetical protein